MNDMALSMCGGLSIALVTGWLGFAFGGRRERNKERRDRHLMAAADLVPPLRELQGLLRQFGRQQTEQGQVAAAFVAWSNAFDGQGHRLPHGWRHVARSVRDAAGTVFGGISLVHLRPDAKQSELAEPDGMWQDYADDYLDYVATSILRWGDSARDVPKTLMEYEAWLVRTGRREPLGSSPWRAPVNAALTA